MKDLNKQNLKRLIALCTAAILVPVSLWCVFDGNTFSRITTGAAALLAAAVLFKREYHDKG